VKPWGHSAPQSGLERFWFFLGKRLTHKAQIFAAQIFCGADFEGFLHFQDYLM
jgi:hypothetical protein